MARRRGSRDSEAVDQGGPAREREAADESAAASARREGRSAGAQGAARRQAADLLEHLADPVFALDSRWRFAYVNGEAEQLLGRPRRDLIGQGIWESCPDLLGSAFESRYREAVSRQVPLAFEALHEPTGRWLEVRAYPSQDGLSVHLRDVTGRREAEEERVRLAHHLRLLLELTEEGFYGIDLEGRCNLINRAAAEMLGYQPAEMLGQRIHPLIHHSHPDGSPYPEEECPIIRAFRLGQGSRVEDELFWRRDGTPLPVQYASHPILESGAVRGAVVVFTSDVERRRAAAALREANDRLRIYARIVESSPDLISVVDRRYGYRMVNPSYLRMHARTEAELVGHTAAELFGEEVFQRVIRPNLDRCFAGESVRYEAWFDYRGAGRRYTEVRYYPLFGENQVEYAAVVVRDITERKKAEWFREEYVSLISHDLRAPLTALMGQAGWLRRLLEQRGLDREVASAEVMLKSARRMSSMIDDLVETARMESGRMELHREPTDLLRLVSEAVDRSIPARERHRIRVQCQQPVGPMEVDPARIERAVVNLITNALKFSPPDSPVTVEVAIRSSEALVSVADQGVGIPPEDLAHLFERFHRARTGGKTEGLGLGLYITRLIVEAHGGRVRADSQVGKGSTFYFTLPIPPEEGQR